jgi:hypothetical protein
VAEEVVGQPHGAERQAHRIANVAASRDGQLTTAAAEVDHQNCRRAEAQIRDQSKMDEAAFFEAGDDVYRPSGGRPHPFQKSLRVAGIAQGTGGDDADGIRAQTLRGAVEAAEDLHGFRHRLRGQEVGAEHTFAEARDFAVFVNGVEFPAAQPGDLEANRVRTDINRGENGHEV